MKKGLLTLLMLVIMLAIISLVLYIFFDTMNQTALIVGAPLMFIYSMICFFAKKIRSVIIIWWGILSLITTVWWVYLLIEGMN